MRSFSQFFEVVLMAIPPAGVEPRVILNRSFFAPYFRNFRMAQPSTCMLLMSKGMVHKIAYAPYITREHFTLEIDSTNASKSAIFSERS